METKVTELACAKVNLTLYVGHRRADGYHDVTSVMQTVSLCDTVTVERGGGENRLNCDLPVTEKPEDNLCMRAAAAFGAALGEPVEPVTVTLEKRIPTQAGLGGGSSDAAAVLRAMRTLFAPHLTDEELETIGAALGSDVPFFIRGGTALATGRGERLSPLPTMKSGWLVIVKPEESYSTAAMYRRLDEIDRPTPPPADLTPALAADDVCAIGAALYNSFEDALPEGSTVGAIQTALTAAGALGALLSGSGSAVFGLFDRQDTAQTAAETLKKTWPQTFLTRPV